MRKTSTWVLVIVVSVFLFSLLMSTHLKDFWPSWDKDEAGLGMMVTLTYDDGSTRTINSADQPFGMTIVDPTTGKTVSSVQVELYATPTFTGQISSYSVAGAFRMKLLKGSNILYDSGKVALQPLSPLPTLTSDKAVVVTSATVSASVLEGLYDGWQSGETYTFVYMCTEFSMSITFDDGTTQTKFADPIAMYWDFKYKSPYEFQSLNITFNRVVT